MGRTEEGEVTYGVWGEERKERGYIKWECMEEKKMERKMKCEGGKGGRLKGSVWGEEEQRGGYVETCVWG